jgi:hypothetical protein
MHMAARATLALLAAAAAAAAAATRSADPRHDFDPRCPPAVALDPQGFGRPCARCEYLATVVETVADCARACCGDWSCLAFRFAPAPPLALSGLWESDDSLCGASNVTLAQNGAVLMAQSLDPARALWTTATGALTGARTLWLCFDCGGRDKRNNRTGALSADNRTISLSPLPSDPANFTLTFVLLTRAVAMCVFMDDMPPLAPAPASGDTTGMRAWLPPPVPPPYGASTLVRGARVNSSIVVGINGDEFPTTWAASGTQLTGAGDNAQYNNTWSPATFSAVAGPPPVSGAFAPDAFSLRGDIRAISNSSFAERLCPRWSSKWPVANIKSSGVMSLRDGTANGTTIWAVSCFNYGDDPTFNRQRYGPAWFAASRDEGATWAADAAPGLFTGRLAAPRFVQAGAGNDGAPDPAHVYALFPGTDDNASFFECNDAAWLGRAPVASVMNRSSWEFYIGLDGAGDAQWDADDSIAVAVLDWPLHTSVQQVNWHAGLQRFVAANWVCVAGRAPPRTHARVRSPRPTRHSRHPLLQHNAGGSARTARRGPTTRPTSGTRGRRGSGRG